MTLFAGIRVGQFLVLQIHHASVIFVCLSVCLSVLPCVNTVCRHRRSLCNHLIFADRPLHVALCGLWITFNSLTMPTVKARTQLRNTPFTRSSKHRANIKHAWWNPVLWLKCRLRLSPQTLALYKSFTYLLTYLRVI